MSDLQPSADIPYVHDHTGLRDPGPLRPETLAAIQRHGYRLDSDVPIGRGATSAVYKATEVRARRKVALKVIKDPSNPNVRRLFEREQKVLSYQGLPAAAVRYHTAIDDEGAQPVVVLEWIDGVHIKNGAARLNMRERIEVTRLALSELRSLNEYGLLFGDLSASNVLLTRDDKKVRFIDLAQAVKVDPYTADSFFGGPGTPIYAPPEQLSGEQPPSPEAEVHAAAALSYAILLAADPPDDKGEKPANWHQDLAQAGVPLRLCRAVVRARRPGGYETVGELGDEFEAWQRSDRQRRRAKSTAIGLVVVALVAALGFGLWLRERTGEDLRRFEALQAELAVRPSLSHDAVRREQERALAAKRRYDESPGRASLAEAIEASRRALELSHEVESNEPLRRALGVVLRRTPWARSQMIEGRVDALSQRYVELGRQLESGDLDETANGLRKLQRELAELAEDNVHAGSADSERLAYERLVRGVSSRLRGQLAFAAIDRRAAEAQRLLDAGVFTDEGGTGAFTEYGRAREQLERFLQDAETPEERAARRRTETDLADALQRRNKELESEFARAEAQYEGEVRELGNALEAEQAAHAETERSRATLMAERDALARKQAAWQTLEPELRSAARGLKRERDDALARLALAEGDARAWKRAAAQGDSAAAETARIEAAARARETMEAAYFRNEASKALAELGERVTELAPGFEPGHGCDALKQCCTMRDGLLRRVEEGLRDYVPEAPYFEPHRQALASIDALIADLLDKRIEGLSKEVESLSAGEEPEACSAALELARVLYGDADAERLVLEREFTAGAPALARGDELRARAFALVRAAHDACDTADRVQFERLQAKIDDERARVQHMLVAEGRRPDSILVKQVDARIEALGALQLPFVAARERALGRRDPLSDEELLVGVRRAVARAYTMAHKHVEPKSGIVFVRIPAGTFLMGSPANEEGRWVNEGPQHDVRVATFELARTEVTQAQWKRVMGTNPSQVKGDDLPVTDVSWDDAQEFCRKLGSQYRLPTEAQWEYACRAMTTTRYWSGNAEAALADVGWFAGNSGGKPLPVAQKPANAFGLHDMHGNAFEWCEDDWDWSGNYHQSQRSHPGSYKEAGADTRVSRGGSYYYSARFARSAYRVGVDPSFRWFDFGFRPARVITE